MGKEETKYAVLPWKCELDKSLFHSSQNLGFSLFITLAYNKFIAYHDYIMKLN